MEKLLILTNCPDRETAESLAARLVDHGLAACVNILAPCTSVYRWQGQVETASEIPLLIKSTAGCYAALEQLILEHHPYELPEIVALPIDRGLPEYLAWVADSVKQ